MSTASGNVRMEFDTFGSIEVNASRYWGAQTQRSLQNFPIGGRESRMPIEVIKGASPRCFRSCGLTLTFTVPVLGLRFKLYPREPVCLWIALLYGTN